MYFANYLDMTSKKNYNFVVENTQTEIMQFESWDLFQKYSVDY